MPEGPEVRRYADQLHKVLSGQPICAIDARTKAAKAWLAQHPSTLLGRRVECVRSHGKNLYARLEGGYFFYSHLMMWGRWEVVPNDGEIARDRRERARITVPQCVAILLSAPVFEIGHGDPLVQNEYLAALGPDALPYPDEGDFNEPEFRSRFAAPEHAERTVGAALLDQTIVAGLGNYLRAEILFKCRINPWKCVRDLSEAEVTKLCRAVPQITRRAYQNGGATTSPATRRKMQRDDSLVRRPNVEWHTRHYVFRRTNLPCVDCGDTIRQKRQITRVLEDDEKTRIIYFCPTCQNTTVELKPLRTRRAKPHVKD
ncbi:MAG TPA: DNA-formamidopyrimidine glycosylase family protein [Abditibacteriaceae bacterium]|jgi:DNA-formamidopyrimidine glycosylase